MQYTVKKNRANRIAMRCVALVFIMVAVLRVVVVITNEEHRSIIVTAMCAACLVYGIILMRQTWKPQAYDITYIFGDETITMKMHRREHVVRYDEITDLGYVVPNEYLDYCLIQIYLGKEQYVISFNENRNVGKALYEMIKLKREGGE